MTTYSTKKLGEVCEKLKIEKAPIGKTPYIEIGDIDVGAKKINFKKKGAVKGSIFAPSNCVIVSRVRPTRGAAVLLKNKIAISSAFTILKPKPTIDLDFLFLCTVQNPDFFNYLGTKQKGSSYPSCREGNILDFEIPLPPIEVQKKIVVRLESLLAKVSEAKKLRAEARESADNLLYTELHKIFEEGKKKGWEEKELGEVSSEIKSGFACSKKNEVSDGVVHLRTHNIDIEGNLNFDKMTKIPEQLVDKSAFRLEKGDILFNNTNSTELVGKTALVTKDFPHAFSNHLTRIRVDTKSVLPEWVVYVFNIYWRDKFFENICNRWVGQSGINQTILKNIKLSIPSIPEQKKIVAHLDSISQKVQAVKELQNTTDNEFDTLEHSILSKAFSGELV